MLERKYRGRGVLNWRGSETCGYQLSPTSSGWLGIEGGREEFTKSNETKCISEIIMYVNCIPTFIFSPSLRIGKKVEQYYHYLLHYNRENDLFIPQNRLILNSWIRIPRISGILR